MNNSYKIAIQIIKKSKNLDELKKHILCIEETFPDLKLMKDFNQECKYHPYNLYDHSLLTALNLSKFVKDDMLYIAALFHDIGKIYTKKIIDGKVHYYGHEKKSWDIVFNNVIPFLENKAEPLSEIEKKRLMFYILKHDEIVGWPIDIYKYVKEIKFSTFSNLMFLQVADSKSHKKTKVSIRKRIVCYTYATFNGAYFYLIFNIYMFLKNIKKEIVC